MESKSSLTIEEQFAHGIAMMLLKERMNLQRHSCVLSKNHCYYLFPYYVLTYRLINHFFTKQRNHCKNIGVI